MNTPYLFYHLGKNSEKPQMGEGGGGGGGNPPAGTSEEP